MNDEVFCYLDTFAVAPGQSAGVHVGSPGGVAVPVTVELCTAGWRDAHGKVETVLTPLPETAPIEARSDPAEVRTGSHLLVSDYPLSPVPERLTLGLLTYPAAPATLIRLVVGSSRYALSMGEGVIRAEAAAGEATAQVATQVSTARPGWWAVAVALDNRELTIVVRDLRLGTDVTAGVAAAGLLARFESGTGTVTVADGDTPFTGRIEAPTVSTASASDLAAHLATGTGAPPGVRTWWDFSRDMTSATVAGNGPVAADGVLVNAPTRAVTGSRWNATVHDWRAAPWQYAAIHFHDTDLDDTGWVRAADVAVPEDTPSGLYAVRCRSADGEDHAPLVVRRPDSRAEVAMLVSTFTYLAYANNSLFKTQRFEIGEVSRFSERDEQLGRHPSFGRSTYDRHSDGSGVALSSALRPILTLRFDHRSTVQDAPRNLGADLFVSQWLRRVDPDHDYLTDHDLHFGGAVGEHVKVLVTGTHPEYFSAEMLDALEAFLRRGGSLMYLGGNGFYWVTTCHPDSPHRIEVRRTPGATRAWEIAPGEEHHATTGERGGLWRHVGRSPNRLVGVGMAGQGWDEKAPGYQRAPEATGPVAERILAGLSTDEVVGDFGYAMGGAAGDEIDRMDPALGTPEGAMRLLTSTGHSRFYKLATEEVNMLSEPMDGTQTDALRSDVCLVPTGFGGHVFSVGSITWAASMAWQDYHNNVETITHNALDHLLE